MRLSAAVVLLVLLLALVPVVEAHSGDEITAPLGEVPEVDGTLDDGEWDDAQSVTLTIENSQCTIYFKHDREHLYVAFDVQQGRTTNFPDTRVFLDTMHDGATSPQDDDFELYINPDNGGMREQQGDGTAWAQVTATHWTGSSAEGQGQWSTEYSILAEKVNGSRENTTDPLGVAFLVYGNGFGSSEVWPAGANIDDPSTWADWNLEDWEDDLSTDTEFIPGDNDTQNETKDPEEKTQFEIPWLWIGLAVPGLGILLIFVALMRRR